MRYKLVIFDLDGTLLNTLEDLALSVDMVLARHGHSGHDIEAYKYFIGNGITKLIERALPVESRSSEYISRLQADFVAYYSEHGRDNTAPYSGVMELLLRLKDSGLAIAVASNKHHPATVELVDYYFGQDIFTVVYGKREGVEAKPSPAIVYDILRDCEVEPSQVLYVGDSGTDMQTAKNAGVCSVGVTWGFRAREELIESGACHIIDTPLELLQLLG